MQFTHRAGFVLSLVSVLTFGSATVVDATESRIEALERQIDRLLAFSERPVPPASLLDDALSSSSVQAPIVVAQNNAELRLRLDRAETQMRQLNGQVEQLLYEMRQLQEQLRRAQEDNEYRLQRLEGGVPQKRSQNAPTQSQQRAQQRVIAQNAPVQQSLEPQILGTLPQSSLDSGVPLGNGTLESGPLDLSALAGGLSGNEVGDLNAGGSGDGAFGIDDPQDTYDVAYGYILTGDYDLAETGFNQFISSNPDHHLKPNATFWLAESLFAQGRYREAANHYLDVSTNYPRDNKAPESLLKLGMSLKELQQRQAACVTLSEMLNKYPQAPDALKRRARAERQNARCG